MPARYASAIHCSGWQGWSSPRQPAAAERRAAHCRGQVAREQRKAQVVGCGRDHDAVTSSPLQMGTLMMGSSITRRFQALLAAAGLPRTRLHGVRHGAAGRLLAQGVHLRVVMQMLGHSTITLTTNTYSHLIPDLQREAATKMGRWRLKGRGWHVAVRAFARSVPTPRRGGHRPSAFVLRLAEGVGFEPTVGLHPRRFSRPMHSSTLPPLRAGAMVSRPRSHAENANSVQGLMRSRPPKYGRSTSGMTMLPSGC